MGEALCPCPRVLRYNLPLAVEIVLVGNQTFQAHRCTGWQFLGTDAYLCPKPIAETIGKACGAVVIYATGRHPLLEGLGVFLRLGDDGVRVVGAVLVDMGDRLG